MSKIGDNMIRTIWAGTMRGIYIGAPARRKHFSEEFKEIIVEIEGQDCYSTLTDSFWNQCPEIRVAKKGGSDLNTLLHWIRKHDLQPPKWSLKEKGKKDTVKMEVIVPYRRFRLSL